MRIIEDRLRENHLKVSGPTQKFFFIHNPYVILPFQMLHGMTFVLILFSMTYYINQKVQPELKASGQTFQGLMIMGVARILGSLLWGYFSEWVGLRGMFLYAALLAFTTVAVFGILFRWVRRRQTTRTIAGCG